MERTASEAQPRRPPRIAAAASESREERESVSVCVFVFGVGWRLFLSSPPPVVVVYKYFVFRDIACRPGFWFLAEEKFV